LRNQQTITVAIRNIDSLALRNAFLPVGDRELLCWQGPWESIFEGKPGRRKALNSLFLGFSVTAFFLLVEPYSLLMNAVTLNK